MGLLDGLFGKNKKGADETTNEGNSNRGAYFLDQDSAKSLGNIEYMRTPKTVKKTFPGIAGREGFEEVEIISNGEKLREGEQAGSKNDFNGFMPMAKPVEPEATTNAPAPEAVERRRSDSSMDLFRNMARDLKKG